MDDQTQRASVPTRHWIRDDYVPPITCARCEMTMTKAEADTHFICVAAECPVQGASQRGAAYRAAEVPERRKMRGVIIGRDA